LYFRRELALAQSLFDRLFSAIDPLPLGLVVASVGGLFHFRAGICTVPWAINCKLGSVGHWG
jgi:hypothetical protein